MIAPPHIFFLKKMSENSKKRKSPSEPSHVDKLSKKERKRLKKEKKAAKALAEQQKTNESNNSAIVDSSSPKNKKSKKDKKNKKSNSASSSNTNSKDKSPSKKSKKSSSKSEQVDDNSPFIEYKPASAEKTYPRWNSFDQLKSAIPDWLIKGSCGEFEKPSNVQSTTWPLAFVNKDVIGVARTGSGKVHNFCFALLFLLFICWKKCEMFLKIIFNMDQRFF